MPAKPDIASHWLTLPHESLIKTVRQLVKQRHTAQDTWAPIRANPVLAARVRGVLSALDAEARGTSDEVMRLMWIKQAGQALDRPAEVGTHSDQTADTTPPTQPGNAARTPAPGERQSLLAATAHQTQPASTAPAVVFRPPER